MSPALPRWPGNEPVTGLGQGGRAVGTECDPDNVRAVWLHNDDPLASGKHKMAVRILSLTVAVDRP